MKILLQGLSIMTCTLTYGQATHASATDHTYGTIHPDAPSAAADWQELIGLCDCTSESRNRDKTWATPESMTWEWRYIMDGKAVQDETIKEDGRHSGSIRQYSKDSSTWYVHYYASATPTHTLSSWKGGRQGDSIVLYRDQAAPDGTPGYYKIRFYNISEKGYEWMGAWVNKAETYTYPTWRISCTKRLAETDDHKAIVAASDAFSKAYLAADYDGLTQLYTENGMLMPSGSDIIRGHDMIRARWAQRRDYTALTHKITSEHIEIKGDTAYDYGYFEGSNRNALGEIITYKGKYVVIWKNDEGRWKMHVDIWNRL